MFCSSILNVLFFNLNSSSFIILISYLLILNPMIDKHLKKKVNLNNIIPNCEGNLNNFVFSTTMTPVRK